MMETTGKNNLIVAYFLRQMCLIFHELCKSGNKLLSNKIIKYETS